MEQFQEYIISGFCRTCNQGQTVTCEIVKIGEKAQLESVDCGFRRCVHTASCQIAKEIQQLLGGVGRI